jgi:hypothetical protein
MRASPGWDLLSPPPPRLRRASCFAVRVDPAKRAARSRMVRAVGFEPTTSWFQARSAAGLRYALKVDHPAGLEPATSRSATGCSAPTELWMDSGDGGQRTDKERAVTLSSVLCHPSSVVRMVPGVGFEPTSPRLQRGAFTRLASQASRMSEARCRRSDGRKTSSRSSDLCHLTSVI